MTQCDKTGGGVPGWHRLTLLLRRALPKSGFARGATILGAGTAIGQMILIAASPVLTRQYTVAEFGSLQVYISLLGLAVVVASLRYEQAIIIPKEDEAAASLLALSIAITVTFTVVLFGLELVLKMHDLLRGAAAPLARYIWFLPASFFGAGVYQALSYWSARNKSYHHIAATKLTQSVSQVSAQLLIGFLHVGLLGLLLGDVIGRLSATASLARLAGHKGEQVLRTVRVGALLKAAVRYKRFPLVSVGSALLNTMGITVPTIIFAGLYGAQVTGWIALVERVLNASVLIIGQAISQVYMSEAASFANRDPAELRRLFRRMTRWLMLIATLPCGFILLFGPGVFSLLFGQPWREAGVYARILSINAWVTFFVWPLMSTLNILERLNWQLTWDCTRLALTLFSFWISYKLSWAPRAAIAAYGGVQLVSSLLYLMLAYTAIQRRIEEHASIHSPVLQSANT